MKEALKKEDIIGHTIRTLHSMEWTKDGVDFDRSFFTLDSGIAFELPFAWSVPTPAKVPEDAKLITGSVVDRLTATPISRMWALCENGEIDPASLVVEFDSGEFMTHSIAEPHGTVMAGTKVYSTRTFEASKYSDYWSLDLEGI